MEAFRSKEVCQALGFCHFSKMFVEKVTEKTVGVGRDSNTQGEETGWQQGVARF